MNFFGKYKFCFFNRNGGVSSKEFKSLNCSISSSDSKENVKKNLNIAKENFKSKEILLMNQIHSNKIYFFKKADKTINADGIISRNPNIALGVLTADCAPIIILGKKNFGIIHAGWRGAFSGIIENSVNQFTRQGDSIDSLNFFVGPHLKKKSFEVKKDFLTIMKRYEICPKKFLEEKNNKIFFDFSELIKSKFKKLGVENFHISNEDTFSNPKKFFSYRYYCKKGIKNCGRQISLVGIKDN
tara:strand:+ start:18 stop:743 length:726 start_codon:yes stop_codon:yes gene_type:complete